jgi:hypothetical protein
VVWRREVRVLLAPVVLLLWPKTVTTGACSRLGNVIRRKQTCRVHIRMNKRVIIRRKGIGMENGDALVMIMEGLTYFGKRYFKK